MFTYLRPDLGRIWPHLPFPSFAHHTLSPHQILNDLRCKTIPLFVYGSLLNLKSAAKSLSSRALSTSTPALAFGLKRLFNRDSPEAALWGPIEIPMARGMLNVLPQIDLELCVNGALMTLTHDDLVSLIAREKGYDLIPIPTQPWGLQESFSYQIAYTFAVRAPDFIRDNLTPVPSYAHASLEGAARFGDAFRNFWITTTYLADQKTGFSDWLNLQKKLK